jgi:hypothetical protein
MIWPEFVPDPDAPVTTTRLRLVSRGAPMKRMDAVLALPPERDRPPIVSV